MESPTQAALSDYFLRTERCHCEMHRTVEKIDFSRVFPFCLSPECLNLECCLGWVFRNFVAQKPFKTNWFTSSDVRAVTVPSMPPWFLLMLTKHDQTRFSTISLANGISFKEQDSSQPAGFQVETLETLGNPLYGWNPI